MRTGRGPCTQASVGLDWLQIPETKFLCVSVTGLTPGSSRAASLASLREGHHWEAGGSGVLGLDCTHFFPMHLQECHSGRVKLAIVGEGRLVFTPWKLAAGQGVGFFVCF